MPLLARPPKPPSPLADSRKLVMLETPNSPESETFRQLRTALEFASLQDRPAVIAVTSALPQEGKSTTVANLAVALARAGRNVALVDLDLFFGIARMPGITDVALGLVKLDEALVSVPIARKPREILWSSNGESPDKSLSENALHVLPAGTVPPNPGEFMSGEALGDVLEALKKKFELILIDTPPALGVGDTLSLSSAVDAMFVVVRLDWLRTTTADDLARVLNSAPVTKLGFVVTGADLSKAYGYGSYGHAPVSGVPRAGARTERAREANT
jgi:Mrp family chromosome partitioning ATPase